jgi:hypothetical protein
MTDSLRTSSSPLKIFPVEALDALLANCNSIQSQVSSLRLRQHCCTVGTQDNITTPCCQSARHLETAPPLTIDRYGRIAHLPPIAVGTLKYTRSEEAIDAIDRGQMIEHSGRYQKLPASDAPGANRDKKMSIRTAHGAGHLGAAEHHVGVPGEVLVSQGSECFRRDTVSREKTMHLLGGPTARRARIT